jgi:hypothetical protein
MAVADSAQIPDMLQFCQNDADELFFYVQNVKLKSQIGG